MSKNEKKKIALFLVIMLAVLGLFYVSMTLLERYMPEEAVTDAGFLTDDVLFEEENKPLGSVSLGGRTYDYYHEYTTLLFMGTDASGSGENETYRGSMCDFLLLFVLDRTENTYQFLPINRDTMTKIRLIEADGSGEATARLQLCTAHWYGGNEEMSCENTVTAVSHLLGDIRIDGYCCLPMEDIPRLNRTVDGVTVTLLEDFTKIDKKMKKGKEIALTDEQAYHYVHDRYGIGNEENISRMQRQRQYLQAFWQKAESRMTDDKAFLNTLYQDLGNTAITNISKKESSVLANEVMKAEGKGFLELEGKTRIGQALGDGVDHVEFYVDDDSLTDVMQKLYVLKKRNGE